MYWYAFPTSYLLAQFVDHGGGWFIAGLVLARVIESPSLHLRGEGAEGG
jgi:hypothetical protein